MTLTTTQTPKLKPDWAGQDWLSVLVNRLIQTKPLYALMKQQARKVLIRTAEKKGVAWRQTVEALEASTVKSYGEAIANPALTYPDYYQVPFHAYDAGNLCWLAAFEAEAATYAMALRVWPKEELSWQVAQERLRGSFHDALVVHGPVEVRDLLDVGCSVGLSTRTLRQFYQQRQGFTPRMVGLDLSPYMLSVAQLRDQDATPEEAIAWVHGKAEETGFAEASFDLVTLQFVCHELPQQASREIFAEIWRILRPGGAIAIVDNNPKSEVIQNLPPVLFTLMKSTEPWTDEYYTFDLEGALAELGFEAIVTQPTDPRHRTIIAHKPR